MATPPDRRRSITFVGHDASRTGAPRLLASGLRWAARHRADEAELRLLLLSGGPVLAEVHPTVPTRVVGGRPLRAAMAGAAAIRSLGVPMPDEAAMQRWGVRPDELGDVVVANTLVTLPLAAGLARRRRGGRLVCHVHELDGVADRVLDEVGRRARLRDAVHTFIAAGPAVGEMLVRRWAVPEHRVVVVDPWIDDADLSSESRGSSTPGRTAPPGAADVAPLVLAVGSMRRRKGPDRFVDLMSLLSQHPRRPQGVWVGVAGPSPVLDETRADVGRTRGDTNVRLVEELDEIGPLLRSADLVVSTALEDPYPLALLEAAAAGTPVAGFAAGGLGTMLGAVGQADAVVPIDDVLGLAEVVAGLLDRPDELRRRGRDLAAWVRSTHTSTRLAPAWWAAVTGGD